MAHDVLDGHSKGAEGDLFSDSRENRPLTIGSRATGRPAGFYYGLNSAAETGGVRPLTEHISVCMLQIVWAVLLFGQKVDLGDSK